MKIRLIGEFVKYLLVFLFFNLLFYYVFYGSFSVDDYVLSDNSWGDQVLYVEASRQENYIGSVMYGASLYPVFMYGLFRDSMFYSVVLNSIMLSFVLVMLMTKKKKYSAGYFILSYPMLFFFSVGYTKEMVLLLSLSLFYFFLISYRYKYYVYALLFSIISRPLYSLVYVFFVQRYFVDNAKLIFFSLVFFTPAFYWVVPVVFSDSAYYARFDNFENVIRGYIPVLSFVGNAVAVMKIYFEPLFVPDNEHGFYYYVNLYYLLVTMFFLIMNYKRVLLGYGYVFLVMLVVLSFSHISHFRYIMPVLFVMLYGMLPNKLQCNNYGESEKHPHLSENRVFQ